MNHDNAIPFLLGVVAMGFFVTLMWYIVGKTLEWKENQVRISDDFDAMFQHGPQETTLLGWKRRAYLYRQIALSHEIQLWEDHKAIPLGSSVGCWIDNELQSKRKDLDAADLDERGMTGIYIRCWGLLMTSYKTMVELRNKSTDPDA